MKGKLGNILAAAFLTLFVLGLARVTGPNFRFTVSLEGEGWSLSHKAPRVITDAERPELVLRQGGRPEAVKSVRLLGYDVKKGSRAVTIVRGAAVTAPDGGRQWVFPIERLPWAGKFRYVFRAGQADGTEKVLDRGGEPLTVRFRGDVPDLLTVLHILPMFLGFYCVILSALDSLTFFRGVEPKRSPHRTGLAGWIWMAIGGVPIGMLMNRFAFGVYWEAWPFGADVTDNKTQALLLLYALALLASRKGRRPWLIPLASLTVLAVYLIPHSI